MRAAIEALEKELHVLTVWSQDKDLKAKREIEQAIDVLKQVEANGGTLTPRKKPKWI